MNSENSLHFDITNINEKIYKLIKQRIIYLDYPPGQRINSLKIQKELRVSQTPIKDALFRLAGEGLVEINSRKGTFVREITEKDIFEIEETRIILETGAVELISESISDEQIVELEKLYQDTILDDSQFEYRHFMEKDNLFHLKVIELTQNQRLLELYDRLNAHVQILRFQLARGQSKRLLWADQDHLNFLNSLKARDMIKAKEIIKEHRIKARDAFLQRRKEKGTISTDS